MLDHPNITVCAGVDHRATWREVAFAWLTENQALYRRHEALADAAADIWFVGRLATYRYDNLDQVVARALATFKRIKARVRRRVCNPATRALGAAAGAV